MRVGALGPRDGLQPWSAPNLPYMGLTFQPWPKWPKWKRRFMLALDMPHPFSRNVRIGRSPVPHSGLACSPPALGQRGTGLAR